MTVYQHVIERDAFAGKRVKDEVMHRPKVFLRKGMGPKTILIGHHDKLKVEMTLDESQVFENSGNKLQFGKTVYLLVERFFNKRAISVNEKISLLHYYYGVVLQGKVPARHYSSVIVTSLCCFLPFSFSSILP